MPGPDIPALRARRDALLQQIADIGAMRPGSLACRYRQRGKPDCRCKIAGARGRDPYWPLTFKVRGKTVSRSIPPAVERTRRQIAEYRRFQALAAELVAVSEQLCQAGLSRASSRTTEGA